MLNLPNIPRMLKILVGIIVVLAGGWAVSLLIAGFGCVPVSGNKGVDLSKDQGITVAPPLNVAGDVSGGLTVVNIAGGAGYCGTIMLAAGMWWRQRVAVKLVDRMAVNIKAACKSNLPAHLITSGIKTDGKTGLDDGDIDAPERLLRKRLKRL